MPFVKEKRGATTAAGSVAGASQPEGSPIPVRPSSREARVDSMLRVDSFVEIDETV